MKTLKQIDLEHYRQRAKAERVPFGGEGVDYLCPYIQKHPDRREIDMSDLSDEIFSNFADDRLVIASDVAYMFSFLSGTKDFNLIIRASQAGETKAEYPTVSDIPAWMGDSKSFDIRPVLLIKQPPEPRESGVYTFYAVLALLSVLAILTYLLGK